MSGGRWLALSKAKTSQATVLITIDVLTSVLVADMTERSREFNSNILNNLFLRSTREYPDFHDFSC